MNLNLKNQPKRENQQKNNIEQIIVGLDLSISSSAITIKIDEKFKSYFFTTNKPPKYLVENGLLTTEQFKDSKISNGVFDELPELYRNSAKSYWISGSISQIYSSLKQNYPSAEIYSFIEGYSYRSTGKVYDIGELGGMVRCNFLKEQLPYYVIQPTQLKQFVFKGNTGKEGLWKIFLRPELFISNKFLENEIKSFKAYLGETIQFFEKTNKSPINDVIDSFFICCLGANNV